MSKFELRHDGKSAMNLGKHDHSGSLEDFCKFYIDQLNIPECANFQKKLKKIVSDELFEIPFPAGYHNKAGLLNVLLTLVAWGMDIYKDKRKLTKLVAPVTFFVSTKDKDISEGEFFYFIEEDLSLAAMEFFEQKGFEMDKGLVLAFMYDILCMDARFEADLSGKRICLVEMKNGKFIKGDSQLIKLISGHDESAA